MNVIVSNKYKDLLNSLDYDIIKNLNGEFSVDELIKSFSNFFFNRMFLDITAIENYTDLGNIQKLSMNIDMSKVILLLDDNELCSSNEFLSQLISLGIYNFTRNREGLIYLYEHPNTYKDVAHIHQINQISSDIVQKKETVNLQIIGIKNLTDHAGATTLVYMLKKQLSLHYSVVAIEVDRKDFIFLNDKDMVSITRAELPRTIAKYKDVDIILIDLNDGDDDFCSDVLYLIEPTTIKLNRMIMLNKEVFKKLNGKKIVLNKSLLSSKDVSDFEIESNAKVYFNLPPMDDKKDNSNILMPFLGRLGLFEKVENDKGDNKIFGLFRK